MYTAMIKSIKLDEQVHRELEELRLKKETFSDAVARLIHFHRDITRVVWSHTGEHPRTPGQGG
jgi:predicted CopG family antitoxin